MVVGIGHFSESRAIMGLVVFIKWDVMKKNLKNSFDLSVIVTAHNEGLLLHKTMLSVFDGVRRIVDAGYTYEIIIHVDNGDVTTKKYLERYKGNESVRIFYNQFGDLGCSRNFAVDNASGEIVAFLDGGDLVSDNWYIKALIKIKEAKDEIVVHPEAVLSFWLDQSVVLMYQESASLNKGDVLSLLEVNKWCSVVMAKKNTFLKIPYFKKTPGYNYEDYVFNIETLAAGIKHEIATDTVLFYRRLDDSMLVRGNREYAIIPYVRLFDFQNIKKICSGEKGLVRVTAIDRLKRNRVYRAIRDNNFFNYFITPIASVIINRRLGDIEEETIPEYVLQEWKKINKVETQLYPHREIVERVRFCTDGKDMRVSKAYCEIAQSITKRPDYVFIVPWLVRGGGDKVVLNYIDALHELHRDWHFAVIATEPNAESPWAKKLPECADFIEFGKHIFDLKTQSEIDKLMSLIITQLDCRRIHIVNSMYGYKWAMQHKALIGDRYDLNVSLFNEEPIIGSDGEGLFGYDDPYLRNIIDVTRGVFTDNRRFIDRMIAKDGFENDEKFKVHYQPILDLKAKPPKKTFVEAGKLHILWAGRVANVKMPEIVAEIGKMLNSDDYVIDIYGEMGPDVDKRVFDGIDSISYHGCYDGFDSLPLDQFDVLLYTSWNDGVPNIILEATMAGLPIVASNDGGVGEVIKDGRTGILIEDIRDPGAYVKRIRDIKNVKELNKYVVNAQKLIKSRHNWGVFLSNVGKDLVDGEN